MGRCSYNLHTEVHHCSCHSYCDFSRSTGLTAEFELLFHPQKGSFSSAKEGSSEIEVIEKIFPGLGVRLHFTMDDYETPEPEHSLTSWPDAVMVLNKCFEPGC